MPSVYDYRHIELDRVGAGKKRASFSRHQHEDTQSRLFGSTTSSSAPSTPRKLSAESLASMSPGRIIKHNQLRSKVFPLGNDNLESSGGHSSSSSSSLDLTDSASVSSSTATMTPGRLIKLKHQTSNVFPVSAVEVSPTTPESGHHHFVGHHDSFHFDSEREILNASKNSM